MMSAQDETYRDAKNIHSKYMRHQAFEAEVKSNKDRLDKLVEEGNQIINEKPDMTSVSVMFNITSLVICVLICCITWEYLVTLYLMYSIAKDTEIDLMPRDLKVVNN